MTAEITDICWYKDEGFSILGIRGIDLFRPQDVGIQPVKETNACTRGYHRWFEIKKKQLILQKIYINSKGKNGKKINESSPQKSPISTLFTIYYNNLDLKMTFTGEFLLVKNFLREGYLHMGFQDPLAYNKVIELQFKKGLLIKEVDLSDCIRQLHEQEIFSTKKIPKEIMEKIGNWLESRKNLNY